VARRRDDLAPGHAVEVENHLDVGEIAKARHRLPRIIQRFGAATAHKPYWPQYNFYMHMYKAQYHYGNCCRPALSFRLQSSPHSFRVVLLFSPPLPLGPD
jgi:hypothetical protein